MGRPPRGCQRLVAVIIIIIAIIVIIITVTIIIMTINTPTPRSEATARAERPAERWRRGARGRRPDTAPGVAAPSPNADLAAHRGDGPGHRDVTGGCVTSEPRGPLDVRRGLEAGTLPRTAVALRGLKTRRQGYGCRDRARGVSPGRHGVLCPPSTLGAPAPSSPCPPAGPTRGGDAPAPGQAVTRPGGLG